MANRGRIDVTEIGAEYGEVIRASDLARILGQASRKTLDKWIAEGRLDGCFRRRGKQNLIVRKLALERIFNGPVRRANN